MTCLLKRESLKAPWQPPKHHSDIEPNQAPLAPVSDLGIGDIARTQEGKKYPVMEASEEGSEVKVLDENNQAIELLTADLSLARKQN